MHIANLMLTEIFLMFIDKNILTNINCDVILISSKPAMIKDKLKNYSIRRFSL